MSELKTYFIIIIFLIVFVFGFINYPIAYADIKFEEVTEDSGISFIGKSYGSSWGDFNNDGYSDLWVGNHGHESSGPSLYLNNRNGTFTDIFPKLGLDSMINKDLHGATWVDFDNDGDQDLLVSVGGGGGTGIGPDTHNFFLINQNGSFIDEATKLGLDFPLGRGRVPVWFDFDTDGFLDVLLVNHPRPDEQAPTTLLRQSSSGFEKIKEFRDIKKVDSVQISDLFQQGHVNLIFLNPSFEAVYELTEMKSYTLTNGIDLRKLSSTDVIISDFNGDLLPDLFRSRGTWENNPFQLDILEINTGKGFNDKSKLSGLVEPTSCRSAVSGDFDNDMDVDIFMVCSIWETTSLKFGPNIKELTGKENLQLSLEKNLPNILYENLGDGKFALRSNAWGATGTELGTGETVTTVDYDNDGFLDLFITNGGGWVDIVNGGPHQLFSNKGNNNHWLEIDLIGTKSNRDGIGTSLLVDVDGFTQFREQTAGVHFRTQNDKRIHVGLGENTFVDSITIFWPSGIVHELKNVLGDQILQITEPAQPIPPKHQISLGVDQSKILCKDELKLIINSKMSKVACVKITSWDILKERGW